ncbi:MAG TPA: hypothetical protein VII06_33970 [Chloroflexota bacterium]|jgi:MFS family permease
MTPGEAASQHVSLPAGLRADPRLALVAVAACGGGGLLIGGALLPWLTLFAGVQTYSGLMGLNGRVLVVGGVLSCLGGIGSSWRGGRGWQWVLGLLGFALLAYTSWLLLALLASYRALAADPLLLAAPGPGIFVALLGALAVFLTLFLPGVPDRHRVVLRNAQAVARPYRPTRYLASSLVIAAGLIHLGVMPEHFREGIAFGAFMLLVGAAQVTVGLLLLVRPNRPLIIATMFGTALVFAVFAVAYSTGLPFGPHPGKPEEPDLIVTVSKAVEGLLFVVLVLMARARHPPRAAGAELGAAR